MILSNILKTTITATLAVFIFSCSSISPPMPTYKYLIGDIGGATEASNIKIILISGKSNDISKALQSNLREVVSDVITDSGSEVVDRTRANRLISELNLNSLIDDNLIPYEGPYVADYVIISTIKKSTVSSKYYEKST